MTTTEVRCAQDCRSCTRREVITIICDTEPAATLLRRGQDAATEIFKSRGWLFKPEPSYPVALCPTCANRKEQTSEHTPDA
jgi:hypothetical protein